MRKVELATLPFSFYQRYATKIIHFCPIWYIVAKVTVTDSDKIKRLLAYKEKKERIHEHIRSGGKLSELPDDLKIKFVDPFEDSK